MVKELNGKKPVADQSARVAQNASLIGNVHLGKRVSVWYGAVLRGDSTKITIADDTNIQDNCTLHGDATHPLTVGAGTTVGHNVVLHGCTVGEGCLIGMSATILNGAVIGDHSIVGAGALVTERKVFPPYSVILGSPAKLVRSMSGTGAEENDESVRQNAAHYYEAAQEQLEQLEF